MPRTRLPSKLLALGLILGGCVGGTDASRSPTPEPTAAPTVTPSPETSEAPTPTPTAAPTETPSPTPTPVTSGPPGGFAVTPNPEADALFLDRDTCMNERDNYEVSFPDDWWTNTEIGRNPACVWFSPTFYEVPDPNQVPKEIAIRIEWFSGSVGRHDANIVDRDDVSVGGQAASRIEWDDDTYWYVIQLGPTPEEGPNLLVETSADMGGDYDLNRAVMDRMMATIQFFGSTQ